MSDKALKPLVAQIIHRSHEAGMSVEPFLADFVARYMLLAYASFPPGSSDLSGGEFDRMLNLSVSLITGSNGPHTTPADTTSHTLRILATHIGEFTSYHAQLEESRSHVVKQCRDTFELLSRSDQVDSIYAHLEALLIAVHQPLNVFGAASDSKLLSNALKVSLNSVLPHSDVLVFRDMLLKENNLDANKEQNHVGVKQLGELVDVASGVTIVGDPPLSQLQALEHSISTLVRAVDVQYAQICGIYTGSVIPLMLFAIDLGSCGDPSLQARCRETIIYSINRVSIVKAFAYFVREVRVLSLIISKTSEDIRNGITALQKLLNERDSVPKSHVYPKFSLIARQHREIYFACNSLNQLKHWHTKLMAFIDDYGFTILPEVSAKYPLYTMDELNVARAWYQKTYSVLSASAPIFPVLEKLDETTINSRILRFSINISSKIGTTANPLPYIKTLTNFGPLDGEDLFGINYLFGGMDPILCFSPAVSRPGAPFPVALPGYSTSLKKAGEVQTTNTTNLSLGNDQTELNQMLKISPSDLASQILLLPEGDGHAFVAFSSVLTRSIFLANPILFMTSLLSLSLSSPEFLPLILLMDLSRVCTVLQDDLLNKDRDAIVQEQGDYQIDLHPCFHNGVTDVSPPVNNMASMVMTESSDKKMQSDSCTFVRGVPGFIPLVNKTIMVKYLSLAEALTANETNHYVFNSPFAIKDILNDSFLTAYSGMCSEDVFVQYRRLDSMLSTISSNDLVTVGADGSSKRPRPSDDLKGSRPSATKYSSALPQEAAIQTPLHFYERNIVPGYTSSEWELRARALRLYQIKQKATHTTQTAKSNYKAVAGTETVEHTDKSAQSSTDASTHATTHFRYINRPVPSAFCDSIAAKASMAASEIKQSAQTVMELNLDDVAAQANKYKAIRNAYKK
ncbi:hypothetical protein QR46_0170 [Giardia duodenalis assemblage B]|uniref:Cilia- and flagella-associated protein 206 n=1 Tax=Giardia duodenalis assemblage B TaxID=1394984 RepID=A0A132P1K0_GIAIN|nr:hypothetical protein QR46_0170 [Giardia intestinalis assemblage B]